MKRFNELGKAAICNRRTEFTPPEFRRQIDTFSIENCENFPEFSDVAYTGKLILRLKFRNIKIKITPDWEKKNPT